MFWRCTKLKTISRLLVLLLTAVVSFPLANFAAKKDLTFGYITPGPDTWYKRDVDGFVMAANLLGIKTVVLNSDYDVQKEVSNIESLITQGVDGMAIFSFNQQGAITAAKKCKEASIPLVTVDNCGQALNAGNDIIAAIDFDWKAMGKNYAEYIAQEYPGKKVALITGLLEHLPVQMITGAMKDRMKELGKNEVVAIDARTNKVTARWPTAPEGHPVSMAMDRKNRRLFSAGRGPQFVVMMDADTGKVLQSYPISAGVDANDFEPATGMLFVATREGMLHIYHEDSPDKLSEVETVKTQYGAKTLQVDPKTHNVFLTTSDFNPPAAPTEKQPHPQATPKPGNFRVLVYGR